jgi:hypothetical protein
MRKVFKRIPFYKVFVFLFVTLYTFLPSVQAVGVVMEDYAKEEDTSVELEVDTKQKDVEPEVYTEEEEKIDTSEDILDKGISDPQWIANPEYTYEDGVYTVNTVIEGEEYVYPDNKDVRVKFTSVTEKGNLVISRVTLTEEQKEELNTSDNYGWSITSSMSNGSFTYDLTLPNTQGNDVEVKYSEDDVEFKSIENVVVNENLIHIEGLDHFTMFVVVSPNTLENCDITIAGYSPNPDVNCFPTIQQAINKAADGDDIYVANGVYEEGYISIENKSVNLIGDSATIKATSSDASAVITINDATTSMTIEGFTIDADNVSGRSGIYIQNESSNVTVRNNNIVNFTDKGVLISNGDSNLILNNTITSSATGSNAGVYVNNNSEDNLIDGNTISLPISGTGNLYNIHFAGSIVGANTISNNILLDGGLRAFQQDGGVSGTVTFTKNNVGSSEWGVSITGGSAIITENTITDSLRPIEFGGSGTIEITNNTIDGTYYDFINILDSFTGTLNPIQHNSFLNMGSADLHNRTGISVDATENYWGDLDPFDNINNSGGGNIDYSPWWGEDYVEIDHSTGWNWYTNDSIQDAIDAASDGDLVLVNEGTYIVPAGIVINKENLTLRAVGEVIVKYSADETAESPYGLSGISVLANMGTVTVEGFTVTGYENGIAQSVTKSTGTAFHVINSTVYPGYKDGGPYMRNGIQVTGIGSRVIGNTVIGAPLTESWSGTAIHVLDSNDVIVENNTITDSFYDIGIGIMNYYNAVDVKNITIRNNSITNAQEAFRISANNGTDLVSDITFENNTISGPANDTVWVYGLNIQKVKAHNILLKDNNITWNSLWTEEIRISSTATASNIIINNGLITGTMIPDDNGAINTELDYAGITDGLTLVAQITGQVGNFTHFSGTISGLIDATVTGSINANGYDSLSAVLTIEGITYPVRFLGDFVQAGSTGGLTGRIVTGDYGPYAESIEIETPKTIIGVGETLQLSVTPNIEVAWTVYVNDQEIGSVDETGLVTGLQGGTFIVIAVAQDGSLLDDTIAITVDDTSPIILDTKMFVDKNGSWEETSLTKSGDEVRVLIEVEDDLTGVEKVQIWVRDNPYTGEQLASGTMTKLDDTHFEFTYTVPNTYQSGNPINETLNGNYFNFRPWDILGNSDIGWSQKFTIDNTTPTITWNNPSDLSELSRDITLDVTCDGTPGDCDYINFWWWRDDQTIHDAVANQQNHRINTDGTNFTWTLDSLNPEHWDGSIGAPLNGVYTIRAAGKDLAGNYRHEEITVTIDNTKPTGEIIGIRYPKADVENFITNDNTPLIYGTAEDILTGLKSIEVSIDGVTGTTTINSDGSWESQFSEISDGSHTIQVILKDNIDNEIILTQEIFIDTTPPNAIYTHYKDNIKAEGITFVKYLNQLSFSAKYTDDDPSSGLYQDSFVIFEAQDDGSFRFSANDKKAYCSWRKSPNLVDTLHGRIYELNNPVPFTNCTSSLPDGEYYMAHQVYDSATRHDIPTINQFRDVLGLHFIVDTQAPESNINIIGNLAETENLNHNNGWHGDGWYYNFAEVKLDITTGSVLDPNEKIQYQILDDNVTCPTTLSSPTEITSGTNITSVVNSLQDGIHTLCYQAKDSAGNLEPVKKEVLKLDRTQPKYEILTNTINGNEVNDVYYISSDTIKVDVNGKDDHSGYFRTRYDLFNADENWNCSNRMPNGVDLPDAVNDKTQTLSLSGLDDGRYCMQIWIYDDVQNKSWTDKNGISTIHFVIDTEFPSTPIGLQRRALDGTIYSCGDYAQLQTLIPDWDDNSDINFDYYEYTSFNANGNIGLDEEILPNSEFVHSWVPTIEGTYGYAVRAVDKAGNKSDWALTGKTLADSCQITYDSTPPIIEPLTQYTYNISEGDPIPDVQTEVTDETGLKKAYYELTNVDLGTFNDDMDLSGTSEIVDTTGLIETYAKDYFGEDITTIDTYYIPEGVYTIEYYVEDIAGNTSPTETLTINITNVAPIIDSFTADVLSITEGDTVNFEAIFSDPSYIEYISGEKHADDAPWIYSFNPEGTYEPELSTNIPGETLSFSHTYNTEGTFVAGFMVCEDSLADGEGQCANETVEITVSNNIPTVEITATDIEVTAGDDPIVLSITVTNGNSPFTYLWSGDCTGSGEQTTFNPTTADDYTCTVTVTDADGDTDSDSKTITVLEPPTNNQQLTQDEGDVAGTQDHQTTTTTTPLLAQSPLGTGGYLYAQTTTEEETEEEVDDTEVEDTEDVEEEEETDVKGTEDENDVEEEQEGRPWWIYPLIILPLLLLFIILWKRRKEEEEPQY